MVKNTKRTTKIKHQTLTKKNKKTIKRKMNNLSNILYNNEKNINDLVNNLKNYISDNLDSIKFNEYNKRFKPFNGMTKGRSGASVGYLVDDNNVIIKFNYYKKLNLDDIIINDNYMCMLVDNRINEIIMNVIITNIKHISSMSQKDIDKVYQHIVPIIDYGISERGSFITMPKIGFSNNTAYQDNVYITNMKELFKYNHIKLLKQILKEDNKELLKLYNDLLIDKLNDYLSVIRILEKHIHFVNTDVKLNNMFVRYEKSKYTKYDQLKDYGFITDFNILLSDFEKSYCHLNNLKIMSYENVSTFKNKILNILNLDMLEKIRFKCEYDTYDICKIKVKRFDILTLLIDMYSFLYYNFKKEFVVNFANLINYFRIKLKINQYDYDKLTNIIKNNMIIYNNYSDIHIRRSLYKICKYFKTKT